MRELMHIAEREPLRPRAIAPRVARDLAAIVEMAMASDPARRYPRASSMAEDLGRFLARSRVG